MSPCLPVVMRKHDEGDGIEIVFFYCGAIPPLYAIETCKHAPAFRDELFG